VLDLTDETLPRNAGRWRLAADPNGVDVSRTRATADLSMDVRTLSAAYLGDDTLARAALAGLVDEHTTGAVAALGRAMRGDRAPHCPYMF
jgi:predicted acetyltransferase